MAMDFVPASSEYVRRASAPVTALPITLVCHFYPDADAWNTMVSLYDGSNGGYSLAWNVTNMAARAQAGGGASALISTGSGEGAWHRGVGVFTTTTSRQVYLDGTAGTENTTLITAGTPANSLIGAWHNGTIFTSLMDGRIAEAAIYNVAWTQADVDAYEAGYSPELIRPDGLVLYTRLMKEAGGIIDRLDSAAWTINGTPTDIDHPLVIYPRRKHTVTAPAVAAVPYLPIDTAHQPQHQPIMAH